MRKVLLFFATILLAALMGCSDKDSIEQSKIKAILNDYFSKNCILLPMEEKESFWTKEDKKVSLHVKDEAKKYDFLTKLGYYQTKLISNSQKKLYSLSEKGVKLFHTKKHRLFIKKGFCVGNYKVKNIQSIQKNRDFLKLKTIDVEFTTTITNINALTKSLLFKEIFNDFDSFEKSIAKTTLFLSKDGWAMEER